MGKETGMKRKVKLTEKNIETEYKWNGMEGGEREEKRRDRKRWEDRSWKWKGRD